MIKHYYVLRFIQFRNSLLEPPLIWFILIVYFFIQIERNLVISIQVIRLYPWVIDADVLPISYLIPSSAVW